MRRPLAFLALLIAGTAARDYDYKEDVTVFYNNVGPYNNPVERYPLLTLPYCVPHEHDHEGRLVEPGSHLVGDRPVASDFQIRFRIPVEYDEVCKRKLDQNDIKQFRDAIKDDYQLQLFVDDLPVPSFVGQMSNDKYYLFNHWILDIAWNEKNVIAINVTIDLTQTLELKYDDDLDVTFSYSVNWKHTNVPVSDRFWLHGHLLGEHDKSIEIHWLSIVNSCVLVVLLMSFLAIILLRILKADVSRYLEHSAEDPLAEDIDDSGWKQVHGDVFRAPEFKMLFSSMVGTGVQLLILCTCCLVLATAGVFYSDIHGSFFVAGFLLYAATSVVGGFVSSRLFRQLGGVQWATNAVLTACVFPVPLLAVFAVVNTISIFYHSTSALPFGTIMGILFLWTFVAFPLTIVGAVKGSQCEKMDVPCKTNRVKREIPSSPWFRGPLLQILMAGFLPFTAIYIELHYLFTAIYGHRTYTLFGILTLAFLLLIAVTAFITVALIYFQLAGEDYRWWWRSFFCGGSTGFFVYLYALVFWIYRSPMSGLLQGSFFFGYLLVVSYAFALMLGAIGFFSSLQFVRKIYQIKID